MKKFYCLLLGIGLVWGAQAQTFQKNESQSRVKEKGLSDNLESTSPVSDREIKAPGAKGASQVFFYEDFEGGFETENGTWTTDGPQGNLWFHAFPLDSVDGYDPFEINNENYSAVANYFGERNTIQSATQGNGFMMMDADAFNSSATQDYPPEELGQYTSSNPIESYLVSPAIDLSLADGQTSLSFTHYYRMCCLFVNMNLFVEITVDGGETWEPVLEIMYNDDQVSESETTEVINISEFVENATDIQNVQLRFHWPFGEQGGTTNVTNGHYFWMIDDIEIGSPPSNDIVLNEVYYDEYVDFLELEEFLDIDYIPETEYSSYYKDQVRPLTFIAEVVNNGTAVQTGVVLTVEVTSPDGMTQEFSSDPIEMEAGVETTLRVTDAFPNAFNGGTDAQIGEYQITYSVDQNEEDAFPGNNSPVNRSFQVNDMHMASDLDTDWTNFYPTIGEDVIWAQRYAFEQEGQIEYLSFGFLDYEGDPDDDGDDAQTIPGSIVYLNVRSGSVLEAENAENVMTRYFGSTALDYKIGEDDLISDGEDVVWVNYVLPEPIAVEPGVVYQGEIEIPLGFEGPYAWIPFSNNASPYTMSYLQLNPDDQSGGPQGWWVTPPETPISAHIRLGMNAETINTEEPYHQLTFKVGQNYPNPSTGSTRIDWELFEPAENVQFRITDVNGKTIYQKDLGNRPAGVQESLELNLNLAAGNYQYAIQIDNNIIVRKMVITR